MEPRSDALVFFGASGDLGYKKILPGIAGDGAARSAGCRVIGVAGPPQADKLVAAVVGWDTPQ